MTAVAFIGAILIVAGTAAFVVSLTQGAWLVAGALLAVVVAVWFAFRALLRRGWRKPEVLAPVERDRSLW